MSAATALHSVKGTLGLRIELHTAFLQGKLQHLVLVIDPMQRTTCGGIDMHTSFFFNFQKINRVVNYGLVE